MILRAVLDTNTVISALLWDGPPNSVLNASRPSGLVRFYLSPFLRRELLDTLPRDRFDSAVLARGVSRRALAARYLRMVDAVTPDFLPDVIPDDPSDNHVLACAVKAKAHAIVSGDGHLLDLKRYSGIPILSTVNFLETLRASNGDLMKFHRLARQPVQ
jgi:putative PIN family toxin of toxin-antitoxin system